MLTHALKLAFRNFQRHRGSFLINVIGLSAGLACTLLIVLWVSDELAVDAFHEKDDRLYQVWEHQYYSDQIMTTVSTPGILAPALKEEVPEVEMATTFTWPVSYTLSVGEQNIKAKGRYVGPDYLSMFSFELDHGLAAEALQTVNSVAISESIATTLYGSGEAAMGQALEIDHKDVYTVMAVFADVPSQSSYEFDLLLPIEKFLENNEWATKWHNNGPRTFALLQEGAEVAAVNAKIEDFIQGKTEDSETTIFLKPYSQTYLYGKFENGKPAGGRIEYVRLFSIIAVFILLIACINFMNLSTARASLRAKEVGVKKAVGAGRGSLIGQYLTESSMIAFMSFVLALLMVWLFLPRFNLITDKEISLALSPGLLAGFVGVMLLTGLLAGSYPALYLSSFKPVTVLKGDIKTSLGELWARRGLVVFQFTISIVLIVAVLVVYQQVQYVQNKHLGYDKENLLYFSMDGRVGEQKEAFIEEAGNLPDLVSVSSTSHSLLGQQSNTSGLEWDGKSPEEKILFENIWVNYDALQTFGVEMVAGRDFSRDHPGDTSKIIFNEAAIEVMGLEDPVGKRIKLWEEYDYEIIGVARDFNFESLHKPVEPVFMRVSPTRPSRVIARLKAGRTQEAIAQLKKLYERFNPGFPFDYSFVDEQYALQYAAEQRVASLSKYFAGFAILISCLGLFGLAAFTADRRKKEIGIRKVLGASVGNIVTLLTQDFTRLVLVAIVLGLPIAYWLVGNWLDQFAYRIDLKVGFFALAGVVVLLIAWLTVGSQAFRSAHIDPRECLRDI